MKDGGRAGAGRPARPPAGTGPNSPDDPKRDLARALAAYQALMDEVVPESAYHLLGKREDPERVAYLGDIVERAAARRREQQRGTL